MLSTSCLEKPSPKALRLSHRYTQRRRRDLLHKHKYPQTQDSGYALRRIYVRIGQEFPSHEIAEVTVRGYVRARKPELGLSRRETFIPQCYAWGEEAQVDWYEATAELGGELQPVQVFAMRSMASGGPFTGPTPGPPSKPC
jgi:hypothetical protein